MRFLVVLSFIATAAFIACEPDHESQINRDPEPKQPEILETVWTPTPIDATGYLGQTKDAVISNLAELGLRATLPPNKDTNIRIAEINREPFDYLFFDFMWDGETCDGVDVYFDNQHKADNMWRYRLKWCGLTSLLSESPEVDEFGARRWRTSLPEGVNLVVDIGSTVSLYAVH